MFFANGFRLFRNRQQVTTKILNGLRSVEQMRGIVERERSRADRIGIEFAVIKFTPSEAASAKKMFEILAEILQGRLRCTDEIGWLGPLQLGVVLPSTPADGARVLADDVLLKFSSIPAPHCDVYTYPSQSDDEQADSSNGAQSDQREQIASVPAMDTLFLQPTPLWKRSLDVVGAVVAMILLSPILITAALAVKLTSRGPVFFAQWRNGLGGKQFRMYKFRTMVVDAERLQEKLMALNEQEGPVFKIRNDPRITRVGRFLRKTSIDELPQLWNVLTGEMSLVGPRPPLQKEVRQYECWQRRRLDVTPGITCTWQVKGRSLIPFTEWMRMDIRYIRSRSFRTDLGVLLQTIPAVLMRKGAN
ncbi:MAG TPA: sugar transferase [Pirellulales bacterium]|jgi:lipopolysaccharide/colanic/teichoic acid biosynthesis glycosyltransferase|nr:sugar transferase [Pirellulales bacterium]